MFRVPKRTHRNFAGPGHKFFCSVLEQKHGVQMAVSSTDSAQSIAGVSLKSLLWLAIPAMISALLNNAYRIIDQYAVQWIGTDAQAAVGEGTGTRSSIDRIV